MKRVKLCWYKIENFKSSESILNGYYDDKFNWRESRTLADYPYYKGYLTANEYTKTEFMKKYGLEFTSLRYDSNLLRSVWNYKMFDKKLFTLFIIKYPDMILLNPLSEIKSKKLPSQ